jgi:hypothetical protein
MEAKDREFKNSSLYLFHYCSWEKKLIGFEVNLGLLLKYLKLKQRTLVTVFSYCLYPDFVIL